MDHNTAILTLLAELRIQLGQVTAERDAAMARVAQLEGNGASVPSLFDSQPTEAP